MVELGPNELRSCAVARGALAFPGESDTAFAIGPEETQRRAIVHDLEFGRVDRADLQVHPAAEVAEDDDRVALVEPQFGTRPAEFGIPGRRCSG